MGVEPRTGAEDKWEPNRGREPRTNESRAEDQWEPSRGREPRINGSRGQMGAPPRTGAKDGSRAEDKWEATTEERGDRGAPPRTAEHRNGLARGLEPRNKRQPTSNNKKESEERKKERVRSTNNDDGETKEKTKRSKRSKQSPIPSKNNNQPDRNGGDLPCGGRQPLNEAADPPNPPSSIFEVAEVVEKRKVSFGESVDARN
jgi:hypothetical protein